MVVGGDVEDEALLLWSLFVEEVSITESILIVHPVAWKQNKKKTHFPHYESLLSLAVTYLTLNAMVTHDTALNPCRSILDGVGCH